MKTSTSSSKKANSKRAILLVALVIALVSAGCQKEDDLSTSVNKTVDESEMNYGITMNDERAFEALAVDANVHEAVNNDPAIINPATPAPATASFVTMKIDHKAAGTSLPDYTVLVRSDGRIIYDGHRNVAVQDKITFMVSDRTMARLHDAFTQYGFYGIVPDFKPVADLPVVYTTYLPGSMAKQKTIYDDYNANPQKLILLRQTIEKILGIERFVYGTISNPDTFSPS